MKSNFKNKPTAMRFLAILLAIVGLGFSSATAQVNFSNNFNANATGWTGTITRTTATTACGSASMRRNMYSGAPTGNMVSPLLGTSINGIVTLSYDYKVANWSANTVGTSNWGSFNVQYSSSASGPWTTVQTIDNSNHVVSGTCATKTVTFSPPAGPLYIKWDAFWTSGDYYINFDNVVVSEIANSACTGTPTPGNTVASANPTCGATTLSVQNLTSGTGVTYQWLSSADDITYAPISGANSATYAATQSTATYYKCEVTCAGNTGTSNSLQVTMSPFTVCYCPAVPSSIDANGATNITIGSWSNPNVSTTTYQNFTGVAPTTLYQGTTNPVTVELQTGFSYRTLVFIDFNQDGDYNDAGELANLGLSTNVNPTTISGNIIVPAGALTGNTGMRLVVTDDDANVNPCYNSSYGNVEDYLITIATPPACSGSPIVTTVTPASATACAGVSTTLTVSSPGIESGYTTNGMSLLTT